MNMIFIVAILSLLTSFYFPLYIFLNNSLSITLIPFLSFTLSHTHIPNYLSISLYLSLILSLSHSLSLSLSRMKLQRQKDGYKPGDYGFDPLGLYSFRSSFGIDRIDEKLTREEKISRAKFDMELCEVRT